MIIIHLSWLKCEKSDESAGDLMMGNLVDDLPDADPGPEHWSQVAPDDGPALLPEAEGLPSVQQGVDDLLPLPLDRVVEAVPGAVVLHSCVTARLHQSTSNVLITNFTKMFN